MNSHRAGLFGKCARRLLLLLCGGSLWIGGMSHQFSEAQLLPGPSSDPESAWRRIEWSDHVLAWRYTDTDNLVGGGTRIYWKPAEDDRVYAFAGSLGQALAELALTERIDISDLLNKSPYLERQYNEARSSLKSREYPSFSWDLATYDMVFEQWSDLDAEPIMLGEFAASRTVQQTGGLEYGSDADDPQLQRFLYAVRPPDPCPIVTSTSDPCCEATDPCCNDPCCGDPCCGDPCCSDPCCPDPCDLACSSHCDPQCGRDPLCDPECGSNPLDPCCVPQSGGLLTYLPGASMHVLAIANSNSSDVFLPSGGNPVTIFQLPSRLATATAFSGGGNCPYDVSSTPIEECEDRIWIEEVPVALAALTVSPQARRFAVLLGQDRLELIARTFSIIVSLRPSARSMILVLSVRRKHPCGRKPSPGSLFRLSFINLRKSRFNSSGHWAAISFNIQPVLVHCRSAINSVVRPPSSLPANIA